MSWIEFKNLRFGQLSAESSPRGSNTLISPQFNAERQKSFNPCRIGSNVAVETWQTRWHQVKYSKVCKDSNFIPVPTNDLATPTGSSNSWCSTRESNTIREKTGRKIRRWNHLTHYVEHGQREMNRGLNRPTPWHSLFICQCLKVARSVDVSTKLGAHVNALMNTQV